MEDNQQPELFAPGEIPDGVFLDSQGRGVFSGERLQVRDPERYAAIIAMLAQGMPRIRIARVLHVSVNTVRAVETNAAGAVDQEKKAAAGLAYTGAVLAFERVIEDLSDEDTVSKIPTAAKATVAGIMTDKYLVLRGEAGLIIDHKRTGPTHEDWLREVKDITADVSDVTQEPGDLPAGPVMSLDGGAPAAKGAPGPDLQADGGDLGPAGQEPGAHLEGPPAGDANDSASLVSGEVLP
jgi:hypothetical protein